jgi:hypothetical protein
MAINQLWQRLDPKNAPDGRLNPKMRDWVLPYWYNRQNNPLSPAFTGASIFRNSSFRNWTAFSIINSATKLLIDRFGVIYLTEPRLSIEIWVHTGERLFTPDSYKSIIQKALPDQGLETLSYYDNGVCSVLIRPDDMSQGSNLIGCYISLTNHLKDALKQSAFYLVIRPYDNNGLSAIRHLEYNRNSLFVNHLPLMYFGKEPKHCYFSGGIQGDVTRYFSLGEGNTRLLAADGLGTGMIGFSGLPAELSGISLFFGPKKGLLAKNGLLDKINLIDVSECLNRIQTGTIIDQLLETNLKYLKTFCGPPESVSVFQLLALNRFSDGSQSHDYLKACLKRVAWDGTFNAGHAWHDRHAGTLGLAQLVWSVADYFKLTGDHNFIEKHWPVLKRAGYAIWYQKVKPALSFPVSPVKEQLGFFENNFWLNAALNALEELADLAGQAGEARTYKEQSLALQSKLVWFISDTFKDSGSRIIPIQYNSGYGAGIVRNLVAAYPLRLWSRGHRYIIDLIHYILKQYFYRGGVFSPLDFHGIDLALSARMGQVLIREGFDYGPTLELLLAAAGGAWSLPDRVHPLTLKGIGENGHDPEVLFQLLLLIRNIFVLEEDHYLNLLPGVFGNRFWEHPRIKINRLSTYFGEISCNCHRIGNQIQIDFWPHYRLKPDMIRIDLHHGFYPVYADARLKNHDSVLEIDPDFHILHLKKLKSAGLS